MLMNEVREKTGLTRKAIEYYEKKGLISPKREENNYRVYSSEDVDILNKIAIYRKLGCSIDEIKDVLQDNKSSLAVIIRDREIKSQLEDTRVEGLKLLFEESNFENVKGQLDLIDREETIYSKLMRAFPGYFGQLLFLSYKPFLEDRLEEVNVKYYREYIDFLDSMADFDLDEEERIYIEDLSKDISKVDIDNINREKIKGIYDPDDWLEENKEILKKYKTFKESDFYIESPIYSIQEKMKRYMEESGYYEKAIPLIRKFSPSYDEYYRKLLEANKKYVEKFNEDSKR